MAKEQLTKTGIILILVELTADKVRSVSAGRELEKGYITFASLGLFNAAPRPFQTWGELHLARIEALTSIILGTICYGYVSAQFTPFFTGRLPVFPGDILSLSGISDTLQTLSASVRFEES
jgi:hypothetical protein